MTNDNSNRELELSLQLGKILGLARMGYAASDTAMTLDLNKAGHQHQYEAIMELAQETIETLNL